MPPLPSPARENVVINTFDLAIVGFVLVSGLLGLSVGFLKGGLWLLCWVGAIFATIYGYAYVEPVAVPWLASREIITTRLFADIAVGAAIFIATLVFLFAVSSVLTGWIRGSRLNLLDRSLGLLAGLVAAVLIVAGAYIPFADTWSRPEDQPAWLREARLRPLIEWGSEMLQGMLPHELGVPVPAGGTNGGAARPPASVEALARPQVRPMDGAPAGGYTPAERTDMNRLLQNTQGALSGASP